jgi:putative flippase GtrA
LSPDVTVVVPTRNEASNVVELLQRLLASCAGFSLEVLFVDDSDDDTPDAIRMAGQTCPIAVGLLHREPGRREGGLGTAVVIGLRHARGSWVVIMDGDLQHPPEVVSELVATGLASGVDLVVASRYTSGGSSQGLDDAFRKIVSASASAVTRTVFSRRLAGVTDPMSGFFAFRRNRVDPEQLRPTGFKILLEVLLRTPGLRLAEVPFTFDSRSAGESKASVGEGVRFVRHLCRLLADMLAVRLSRPRRFRSWRRPLGRAVAFGAVGASGIAVNVLALWLLSMHTLHLHYLVAAGLATQVSTSWNFALTDRWVFGSARTGAWWQRAIKFFSLSNATLPLRLLLLALLVDVAGFDVLLGNVATLTLLFVARFALTDRFIYAQRLA